VSFAVAEMTFSPPLAAPVTYDDWMRAGESLDGCLAARAVRWLYSLVTVEGDRSLCLFEVPYARVPFLRIWNAIDTPSMPKASPEGLVVVVETDGDTHWLTNSCSEVPTADRLAPPTILTDGKRTCLQFSAMAVEEVRSHCRLAGISCDRIWQATLIQPSNDSSPAG
jgi:hypothetical protein